MPNKILDATPISDALSKRKKLTEDQRVEIYDRANAGESKRVLAREFEVSRRTIQFIATPESYEVAKAQRRGRWQELYRDGRYYDRDEHREAIADLRTRKKIQLNQGATDAKNA